MCCETYEHCDTFDHAGFEQDAILSVLKCQKRKLKLGKGTYYELVPQTESRIPMSWQRCASLHFADLVAEKMKNFASKGRFRTFLESKEGVQLRLRCLITPLYEATKNTWTHMPGVCLQQPGRLFVCRWTCLDRFEMKRCSICTICNKTKMWFKRVVANSCCWHVPFQSSLPITPILKLGTHMQRGEGMPVACDQHPQMK